MKNIIKDLLSVYSFLSSPGLRFMHDVESLDITRPTAARTESEAYAKYLSNLREYKSTEHK